MKQSFNVKMNKKALGKLQDAQLKALSLTAEKLVAEKVETQEIPFHEGTLQNVQTSVDEEKLLSGSIKIRHDTPYAAKLYYNPQYDFDKTFNTNAKGEWWEDYISGANKSRAQKIYETYYNRATGGVVK